MDQCGKLSDSGYFFFFFVLVDQMEIQGEKKEIKVDSKAFVPSKENDVIVIFKLMDMGTTTGRRDFGG